MLFKKIFIKNGQKVKITFRQLKLSDAKAAMEFINKFVDEKAYVSWEKYFTLKQETEWVKNTLKKIERKEMVSIFAFQNGEIIGSCGVEMGSGTTSHTGKIGIAIAKDYRSIGLGKFMMQYM